MKSIMKITYMGGVLCAALMLAGCAGRPGTATVYKPTGIFGGYKDKVLAPNMWEVTGSSNGIAERGFGQNMAAYRAAELAKAAGFSHYEIIDQKGKVSMVGIGYGNANNYAGEQMTLVVRGKSDSSAPTECRAKNASACFTVNVDQAISRLEPLLTFPKGDPRRPEELSPPK